MTNTTLHSSDGQYKIQPSRHDAKKQIHSTNQSHNTEEERIPATCVCAGGEAQTSTTGGIGRAVLLTEDDAIIPSARAAESASDIAAAGADRPALFADAGVSSHEGTG